MPGSPGARPAPVGARCSPQGALPGLGASGRAGAGAAPRGGSAGRVPPSRLLPASPPLGRAGGAAGLPRSSSHGACPAGGTALLLSRRPLTGTRRGRRGLVGAAAGRQVRAGGAPEGTRGAGGGGTGAPGSVAPGSVAPAGGAGAEGDARGAGASHPARLPPTLGAAAPAGSSR